MKEVESIQTGWLNAAVPPVPPEPMPNSSSTNPRALHTRH